MTNTTQKYSDFLQKAGLTADQATIYEALLRGGVMPARKISLISGMKRPMAYKVIDQLIELGLIEKIDKKVALFAPAHPDKVADIIIRRQDALRVAEQSFKGILGSLTSDFNLYSGKPNVRFYEGVSGVETLYDDILLEKKDILLIRSPFDDSKPELAQLVNKQIKRQVEANIHTRAITPVVETSINTAIEQDTARLVTRCLISKDNFMIPAQILIYGDKVALTSYKDFFVTTIIQNPDIKETFEMMFNYIWNKAEKESVRTIENAKLK